MSPGRDSALITILIVFGLASAAAASQQAADDELLPTGSSRLTGRVIAEDNGQAVRGAYVTIPLSPPKAGFSFDHMSGRRVQTDANGQFEFAHLPAGSHTIYVDPIAGFLRPREPAFATLVEGGTGQVTIRVARAGAIEGRVLDDKGDPVLGAQVDAVRRIDIAGYVKVQGSRGSATTDDRGAFRIFNLPPGEFYVVATYRRRHSDIDPKPQMGFTNTYYPNAVTLDRARPILVRAGRDTRRVNVTFATRRLVRVFVHAVNAQGAALGKGAWLHLTRRDGIDLPTSSQSVNVPKDGTFVFEDVTPGDYYLIVSSGYGRQDAAYLNVTVGNEDLSLTVQTNNGARVSGRVMVDGRPLGDEASATRRNVTVSANRPAGQFGFSYAEVPLANLHDSDRFELHGPRGPMVLSAEIAGGMLVSIRRGGEEIAGKTLTFVGTENIDDIVIEFTTKTARLDVTVTGTPAPGASERVLVVLFADDPSRWHYGHLWYDVARPSARQSGKEKTESHMTMSRIVPGRYRIIAIHDPDIYYPTEPAILEKLRPVATPVTLVADEPARISIGVTRLRR
jgi:carboxypeptidase family protein